MVNEQKLFASIINLLLVIISCYTLADTTLQNARLWRAPDNTRVVFDLSGPVKHNMSTMTAPERIIIDIQNVKLATSLNKLVLKGTPITSLQSSMQNGKNLRLVFNLSAKVTPKVFTLTPNKPYGDRLVVDLFDDIGADKTTDGLPPPVTQQSSTPLPKPTVPIPIKGSRDIIIAIDPGHGGEDPGAIGSGGRKEKDVVLKIATELKNEINKQKGFRAELTRKTDYFIPLRQRPQIARKKGADLFVSIHADAAPNTAAFGSSVFALSQRGATSETARWLADTENRSDLIGGAGSVSLDDKDQVLAGVLLDLSMTAVMSSSLDIGQKVLDNLGKITHLHKKRVEQAGFVVLKSPDIPSILVETGFISNPKEAKNLATPSYQKNLAQAIKTGIVNYFYKNPPPGTYLEQLRRGKGIEAVTSDLTHKVVKGDTLSSIASKYGISIQAIRSANKITNDHIRIGQLLTIPAK